MLGVGDQLPAMSGLMGTVHIQPVEEASRAAGCRQVGGCHVGDAEKAVHQLQPHSMPSHLQDLR